MQIQATPRRLLQAGLLNPTVPNSRRTEASQPLPARAFDGVETSRESPAAQTPEAVAPEQPDGFDFTGVDWDSFDWDSWEMPTLGDDRPRWRREMDPEEYRKKRLELTIWNYKEIEDRVRAHYQPECDKIKHMDKEQAIDYLIETYKKPFSTKVLNSRPPNGMSKREADVAYDQLLHLYLYNTTALLADPYALSPSDIQDLSTAESRAKQEADQYFKDAWDAAHPGYDPEKEKAQRKAAFREKVETVRRTNLKDLPSSACLSGEVLSLPAEAPGFSAQA